MSTIWFPQDDERGEGYELPKPYGQAEAGSYAADAAVFAALCCQAAYAPGPTGAEVLSAAGFEDVRFIEGGSTQAYIARSAHQNAEHVLVAFRGTDSIQDCLVDARIRSKRLPGEPRLRVHRGFDRALDDVWEDIESALSRMRQARGPIVVHLTGHSLGGALALLAAYRIAKRDDLGSIGSVITIGCPRVGNARFAKALGDLTPIHRVVHAADMVPRVPPWLFGYRQAGAEHWLLAGGRTFETGGTKKPSIATRTRWLQLAYEQSYAFRQYLLTAVIAALLLATAIYKGFDIDMPPAAALLLATGIFALELVLVTNFVPLLPVRVQRWFRPHATIDHGAARYVRELAARAGRSLTKR